MYFPFSRSDSQHKIWLAVTYPLHMFVRMHRKLIGCSLEGHRGLLQESIALHVAQVHLSLVLLKDFWQFVRIDNKRLFIISVNMLEYPLAK